MYRTFICVFALVGGLSSCSMPESKEQASLDWQGHRGARGLAPENSIAGFLRALDFPEIQTLELDLVVSQDRQLIVSHEPWMGAHICRLPDGNPVTEAQEDSLLIFNMTLEEVQRYDCGSRGNARFPEQRGEVTFKPLLQDVVYTVDEYADQKAKPRPRYNIELKSRPEWYAKLTPPPAEFARLLMNELTALDLRERSTVQSFDMQILEAVHRIAPKQQTALLTEETAGLAADLARLSYRPEIVSPYHQLVSRNYVEQAHELGMRVVPWTVNEVADMRAMLAYGVDGIITDYPNRIAEALAE